MPLGYTGMARQEFVFDWRKYTPYHYAQSADGIRMLYSLIREAIVKGESTLFIEGFTRQGIDYQKLLVNILNDSPLIFWVQSTLGWYTDPRGTHFHFCYNDLFPKKDELMQKIVDKASVIFDKCVKGCKSKYEVALSIHDYLTKTVAYDYDSLPIKDLNSKEVTNAHSLIGPLLYGKGVCDGISDAYSFLLSTCGIKATTVSGNTTEGEPHAWNIIRIEGEWYHVDVTWDLNKGNGNHWFFCLNDAQMSRTRIIKGYVPCNGIEYNYIRRQGTYFIKKKDAIDYVSKMRRCTKEIFCEEEIPANSILSLGRCSSVCPGFGHWFTVTVN